MEDEHSETKISQSDATLDLAAYSAHQKSVVWKYFGIEKNSSGAAQRDRRVMCKICSQKVTHGGGTTNLKNHLKTNHQAEFEELYGNEQLANQTSMDCFVQLPSSSSTAQFVACSRTDQRSGRMDGCGFLNLMEIAEPRYTVPCRKTIMNLIKAFSSRIA